MTKFFLLFLLAASSCQVAFGDAPPLTGQKIAYRRDVPENVARSLPRQTARLFWGAWAPQTDAPTMGVQLYESQNGLTLELWEKKQKSFVRINYLAGLYQDHLSPDAKFGLNFYWLDSTHKTTPVLVLTKITYENLMPGEYRAIAVISFASGWKSEPSIQTFDEGDSNSGSSGFSLEREEKGILELFTSDYYNSGLRQINIYDWDGKQFSLVPEKTKTVYPTNDN